MNKESWDKLEKLIERMNHNDNSLTYEDIIEDGLKIAEDVGNKAKCKEFIAAYASILEKKGTSNPKYYAVSDIRAFGMPLWWPVLEEYERENSVERPRRPCEL